MNAELQKVREAIVTGNVTKEARDLCEKYWNPDKRNRDFADSASNSDSRPSGQSNEVLDKVLRKEQERVAKLEELARLQIKGDDLERMLLWKSMNQVELNVEKIIKITCQFFGQSARMVTQQGRKECVIEPRHVSFYLARKLTGASLEKVGEMFDGRDHGTVFHGVSSVQNRIETEPEFKRKVDLIEELCIAAITE